MTTTNDIHYVYDDFHGMAAIYCGHSAISYPLHNHVSVFTIGMVLAGTIALTADRGRQVCRAGRIFLLPPYLPHRIEAIERYTLLSLCIHKSVLTGCKLRAIKTTLARLLCAPGAFPLKPSECAQAARALELLPRAAAASRPPDGETAIGALQRRLELFPEQKLSVDAMARLAFAGKYHFIRSFKREIGLTPHQFQLQNRIRKAQRLLAAADTMTNVALDAGFCDQSHFIKQFKRQLGLTPAVYKASCEKYPAPRPD